MSFSRPILVVAFALAVTAAGTGAAGAQTYRGRVPCAWGSPRCNPCVTDVVATFDGLAPDGEVLGFALGGRDVLNDDNHWQGVQRLMAKGGRYLVLSIDEIDGRWPGFVVAKLASRSGGGAAFGPTPIAPAADGANVSPPDEGDKVVLEWVIEGTPFEHAGGIQVSGDILAIPLEHKGAHGQVLFYDLGDPEHPELVGRGEARAFRSATVAALGLLRDGRLLLVVGGRDYAFLDFHIESEPRSLDFARVSSWHKTKLDEGAAFLKYQSINLVTQCDGTLFLVATDNKKFLWVPGEDWAHLFRIDEDPAGEPRLKSVRQKRMHCRSAGARQCYFRAAAGTYVDPAGRLYLYATERDHSGPPAPGGDPRPSVRMMEFTPAAPGP